MNKKIFIISLIFLFFIIACVSAEPGVSDKKISLNEYKDIVNAKTTPLAITNVKVKFPNKKDLILLGDTREGNFSNFYYDEKNNVVIVKIGANKSEEYPIIAYGFPLNEIINDLAIIMFLDKDSYACSNAKEFVNCDWVEKNTYGYKALSCEFSLKTVFDDGIVEYIGELGAVFFD